jgi:hypothetical protein
VNWCNKDEEGRWWQIVRCSCCRVGDAHSTDFFSPLVSPFIRFFFIPSPLKPCGYFTCLIMMRHVPFSLNLYTTWHILRNHDLQKWRKMFFPSASRCCWGWVYKNKFQNEYQMAMQHVSFSPNLYTTAWHVLRNDLGDLRMWRTCKLAFPSAGWRCWVR